MLTNRIRELRRERKWTLLRLSTKSGISVRILHRIEHGGIPKLAMALQLAHVFKLTVYEIWCIPTPPTAEVTHPGFERIRVAALRQARNLSIADLATLAGIRKATLYEFERGWLPNLHNALRVAAALQVSVHELVSLKALPKIRRRRKQNASGPAFVTGSTLPPHLLYARIMLGSVFGTKITSLLRPAFYRNNL